MQFLRPGTNKTWGAFVLLYVVAALSLDVYWLFTESGPVFSLATWQAAHVFHGSWLPKLTLFVLFGAQLLVLFAIKLALEKSTGKQLTARR